MSVPAPSRAHLPHAAGVYIMRDAAQTVLYVGKAIDLAKRVAQYFNPNKADLKNRELAPLVRKIDYIACDSEREALIWERRLIQRYQPFFNSMWKDDKSYPYVKITLNEDYPRIFVTRIKKKDMSAYFGPYPKVTPVRSLVRSLWKRRLFPLRPCDYAFSEDKPLAPAKIKSCLYYHTRECPAPCAGRITKTDYRKIAESAVLFFEGRYSELKKTYLRRMKSASRALRYEEAARNRDAVAAIEHMGERVRYHEVRPGRVSTRLDASAAITALQKVLALPKPPHVIECFDISHLFGTGTVASMVRFVGGAPERSGYRTFRIKTVSGIDDFASMAEVVHRRYRDPETPGRARKDLPDLVLIDGGKGQLSAAAAALAAIKAKIPLASLAKREEELFCTGSADPIILNREDPALRLLQRLRDEAHRFAVRYHRKRRTKELFK